jgi:hypothetical protein
MSIAGVIRVSAAFSTPTITKSEYNASEPVNDRNRWLDQFVHPMGHTEGYSREDAIAEIDIERTLPACCVSILEAGEMSNGRFFTDDVIGYRIAFLAQGECPPSGLKPHSDILKSVPYLDTPHQN